VRLGTGQYAVGPKEGIGKKNQDADFLTQFLSQPLTPRNSSPQFQKEMGDIDSKVI